MVRIKTLVNKAWVFAAAAAIIAGSSSVMAFTLNNSIPESVSANTAAFTGTMNDNIQSPASKAEIAAEYSVVDLSKKLPEQKDLIIDKLSKLEGITPEEIDEKCNAIIANTIPGEKDISAEQAAAYAAGILKKAYGVDFTGYTAEAGFSRNPLPNSDSWTVVFHASQETESTKRYIASVNSVSGIMLDAGSYDLDYKEADSKDLKNPVWTSKAVQEISKLLPENVSITGSKVVMATPQTGVTVVCELSNGSALAVRLTGENKQAEAYIYFPNGYDGSLDYRPVIEGGVG